jgi:hypothetical protein
MAIKLDIKGTLRKRISGADRIKLLAETNSWFADHSAIISPKVTDSDLNSSSAMVASWLDLHPGAESVKFSIDRGDCVHIRARTSAAGPGYHAYLCDLIIQLGKDLDISWIASQQADQTKYFQTQDLSLLNLSFINWFGELAQDILNSESKGAGNAICMPSDSFYPDLQHSLLTQLGPRHSAWLEAIASRELDNIDICPWWEPGFGASYHLGHALTNMWNEVRWRKPIVDDETDLLNNVSRQLQTAHQLDPALRLPWEEWGEILQLLEINGELLETTQRRAAQHMKREPIGYRRYRAQVNLPLGWHVILPGSFCHDTENDRTTFLGYDNLHRNFRLTPYRDTHFFKTPLRKRFAKYQKICEPMPLEHKNDKVQSKAFLKYTEDETGQYWMLHGMAAADRNYATFTIAFEDENLRDWAIDTWHSIGQNNKLKDARSLY